MMVVRRIKKNKRKVKLFPFLGRFSPTSEVYDAFWQKGLGGGTFLDTRWTFNPSHYEGESPKEKRESAYQDAKQHAGFYKELVKEGIYPEGTKVKVKRKRHSDNYIIEFFMPNISPIREMQYRNSLNLKPKKGYFELKEKTDALFEKMRQISKKYRHKWNFNEDPWHLRNYGVDNEGNVKYLDTEILDRKLPFEKRLSGDELTKLMRREKEEKRKMMKMRLEERVIPISTFLSFILALFFLSPNITGNVIGDLSTNSTNLAGIALIIVSILFGFLTLKNYNQAVPRILKSILTR